jgi:hypothetical protein
MKIQGTWYRSLRETDGGAIAIIDQRWLPHELRWVELSIAPSTHLPASLTTVGNQVNLHISIVRQGRHSYRGAARLGRIAKIRLINSVYRFVVAKVGNKNARHDHFVKTAAGVIEHQREVVHHSANLLFDGAFDHLACDRVFGELTGDKQKISCSHGVGVGGYWGQHLIGQSYKLKHGHDFENDKPTVYLPYRLLEQNIWR